MKILRCAIYTRKSTEDGLEQDFNSLQAQREACEAYVLSQRSEGWMLLPDMYDDGGFSGGSMERPGLKQLLADVGAGKIDIIVVYKVDRLTRSLMDFARIVEILDEKGASFVSVTQSFNTTSSMGRLTLNVLLSFAQFEREVTAERIRDKIAASKKKGMWMGGVVPLGYDVKERRLIIDPGSAKIVRWIYETYLELGCVRLLKLKADQLGYGNRNRVLQNGLSVTGKPFSRGQLYNSLQNPIYIGKVHHQGKLYDGQQEGIISKGLWDRVQSLRQQNYGKRKIQKNSQTISWLSRILHDDHGRPMVASQTCKGGANKGGRRYRYYVSAESTGDKTNTWRLPARQIEAIVLDKVREVLLESTDVMNLPDNTVLTAAIAGQLHSKTQTLLNELQNSSPEALKDILRPIIRHVQVKHHQISITMDLAALQRALNIPVADRAPIEHTVTLPLEIKRRGVEMKLIIPGKQLEPASNQNNDLFKLVARAHTWFKDITSGKITNIQDIARRETIDLGDVSRILPLAFLAPDIVEAIAKNKQPEHLTAHRLKRIAKLPLDWQQQRALLGFPQIN